MSTPAIIGIAAIIILALILAVGVVALTYLYGQADPWEL